MDAEATPAVQAVSAGSAGGVMEHQNLGTIQLGLVALAFGGLQVWWISSVFWRRDLARPKSGGKFADHWSGISRQDRLKTYSRALRMNMGGEQV